MKLGGELSCWADTKPSPFPLPQSGEGDKQESDIWCSFQKIPSPIPMGEGEGEGNFTF
jgi:hypothetical protein